MELAASNIANLRCDVPPFDTTDLARHWQHSRSVIEDLHEQFVPCALTLGTRRMLFQLMLSMQVTDVLEIGTYLGTSTLALALAAKKTRGRVVSVDLNDVNGPDGHWKTVGRRFTPRELIDEAGASDLVDFVTMDSRAFLVNSARQFDLIIIDGWHDEECVYQEIPLAIERLKPNGLIFMDDIQPVGPPPGFDVIEGPWNAVQRHLREGLEVEVHFVDRTLDGEEVALAFLTRMRE